MQDLGVETQIGIEVRSAVIVGGVLACGCFIVRLPADGGRPALAVWGTEGGGGCRLRNWWGRK